MARNKQAITTAVVTLALLLFIGWSFMHYIGKSDGQAEYGATIPPKAVTEQAEALNVARLDEMALQGKIAQGMSMSQVKTALGEPVRTYTDSSSTQLRTTWWYARENGRVIRFGTDGKVIAVE